MRAGDEVAALAVDPHRRDRHAAGDELLDEGRRVALKLVQQRAHAGDPGRESGSRGVDHRHARGRGVVDVDGGGPAKGADGGDRAAQVGVGLGHGRAAAELELPGRRDVGQALDARDAHRADPEPVAQRRADARRGREHGAEGDEEDQHGDERRHEPAPPRGVAPAPRAVARLEGDPRLHGGGEVGGRRPGDVVAQSEQLKLELGHGAPTSSTPSCARRRSSAREVRDLTVPRRQPRAAAVSSSESSSR